MKKKKSIALLFLLLSMMCMFGSLSYAEDLGGLDNVGNTAKPQATVAPTTPQQSNKPTNTNNSGASAIVDLTQGLKVDKEATEKAKAITSPIQKVVKYVGAVILGVLPAIMFLITVADLVYIFAPPLRRFLYDGGAQAASGGMGGMGMGGFGGMSGGAQQASKHRWVSDEAVAAVTASQASTGGGGGFGGGFGGGGFGGGGFGGMGGFGGSGGASAEKAPSAVKVYLKKRVVFLVVFGVCIVLFSTMVFTDIGLKLGLQILEKLTGLESGL